MHQYLMKLYAAMIRDGNRRDLKLLTFLVRKSQFDSRREIRKAANRASLQIANDSVHI